MRSFHAIVCLLLAARAGWAAGPSDVPETVARLDAMRLPGVSFAARMDVSAQAQPGAKDEARSFDLFARRTSESAGATFDVVLRCNSPASDLGKRILFTRDGCWLHDPKAKRPVKVPARQVWSQGSATDSLAWNLGRDFEAADGGPATLELEGGGGRVACHRYEFTPKPSAAFAAGRMTYWLDSNGNPLQAVHAIGAGHPWRTVQFTGFGNVLGARHPVAMRTFARNERFVITLSAHRALDVPAEWTAPGTFGSAGLPAVP